MNQIAPLLTTLSKLIAKRSRREQFLLLVTIFAVIAAPWYSMVAEPILTKQHALKQVITGTKEKNSQLQSDCNAVMVRHQADPDLENRRLLKQLQDEINQFDVKLQKETLGLIPPKEMAQVLGEILQQKGGLQLVKLENLEAVPLMTVGGQTDRAVKVTDTAILNAYQHGLRLEFEGSYLDALAYLHQLEGLPHRFIWDEIEIDVLSHPKAKIVITMHTLSLQKGWIGV